MNRLGRTIGGGAVAAVAFALSGCEGGPDPSSSTARGRVKGTVIWEGKPLANAEIKFNPSNANRKNARVATATILKDGSFELTTFVGQNHVSLAGPGTSKAPQLSYFSKVIDVKSGSNDLDITIP